VENSAYLSLLHYDLSQIFMLFDKAYFMNNFRENNSHEKH